WQDKICCLGGYGRIGVGYDNEVFRIPVPRISLFLEVCGSLQVVVDLHPIGVELAVAQHAVLQYRVVTRLRRDRAVGQLPDSLGNVAMSLVRDQHVGRQPVRERADLARGAACRWLPGERERTVARFGDFSCEQVNVVDKVVAPDTARVLVEAHGPEAYDFCLGIGVKFSQIAKAIDGYAG